MEFPCPGIEIYPNTSSKAPRQSHWSIQIFTFTGNTRTKGSGIVIKLFRALTAPIVILTVGIAATGCSSQGSSEDELTVGYASCAHCLAMELTPGKADGVKLDMKSFQNGNDSLTALLSGSVDVAQVTYGHWVSALNRGAPVVAISGQINGGSDIVLSSKMDTKIAPGNWDQLASYIKERAQSGNPLTIGTNTGSSQDLQARAQFRKVGIDDKHDLKFINISSPADFKANLATGQVDMVSVVEPYATDIINDGTGYHFAYPYDQPMGDLTNVILANKSVIENKSDEIQKFVDANVQVVEELQSDKKPWSDVIVSKSGLDASIAEVAVDNAKPDYTVKVSNAESIAKNMFELGYTNSDVSSQIPETVDYSYLEKATGKTDQELGA